MPSQDVANCLIADLITQISQRPRNPVIPPITVLLGHVQLMPKKQYLGF